MVQDDQSMGFDEYEYLERTAEVEPESAKALDRKIDDRRRRKDRSERDSHDRDHHHKDDGRPPRHGSERSHEKERTDRGRERKEKDMEHRRHVRDNGDREPERRGHVEDRGFRAKPYGRSRDFKRGYDNARDRETSSREKDRGGPRYSGEKRDKREGATSSEPEADAERDQRTVFAFQISLKADEKDVYDFFSQAGKVRDVRLIMDRISRRSKGVGYVEFYDAMSVPMAIAMTGQLLLGQPVLVKPSEAEKNLVQPTPSGVNGGLGPQSADARRLYVGNLHYNITKDQLKQVFESFGAVEFVQLPTDPESGQCKGYGFVQYEKLDDARSAQNSLNGVLELAGRVIKVLAVTDQANMQEMGITSAELDDDEGAGMSLTAQSRTLLMQKLDRSGTVTSITSGLASFATSGLQPAVPIVLPSQVSGQAGIGGMFGIQNGIATGSPTPCLLLKNMFDPQTETEPDFDIDIKDEVQNECSKFGTIKHIHVDKNSAGHVYVRFEIVGSAVGAQRTLHGRWFAGKMISALFLTPQEYELKFPESK